MTASPITSPLSPFATGAVRPSASGGATDPLGLFALLLAGTQAVPAEAAPSAQPGNKTASALPLGATLEGSILPASVASSEQIPAPPAAGALESQASELAEAAALLPVSIAVPLPTTTAGGERVPAPQVAYPLSSAMPPASPVADEANRAPSMPPPPTRSAQGAAAAPPAGDEDPVPPSATAGGRPMLPPADAPPERDDRPAPRSAMAGGRPVLPPADAPPAGHDDPMLPSAMLRGRPVLSPADAPPERDDRPAPRSAMAGGRPVLPPVDVSPAAPAASPGAEPHRPSMATANLMPPEQLGLEVRLPAASTARRAPGILVAQPRPVLPDVAAKAPAAPNGPAVRPSDTSALAPIVSSSAPMGAREALAHEDWLQPTLETVNGAAGHGEPKGAPEAARAEAPLGRAAPVPVAIQVGVHIAKAAPARIDRLFVQLEPASLGRVEVHLEFHHENQVSAVIATDRPDTLEALQRDARALERSLQDVGLRLGSDGLTFSLKREQGQDHQRGHAEFAPAGELSDQPAVPAHADEPPPAHWLHGVHALDITI